MDFAAIDSSTEVYQELPEDFLTLLMSPNPLRDYMEIYVDGADRTRIRRERFLDLIKKILDYSNPEIKEVVSFMEVFTYEYGGWALYDRTTNTVRRLEETAAMEFLCLEEVRDVVKADMQARRNPVVSEDMQRRYNELLQLRMGRKKKLDPNKRFFGR
jgi:uncharacterized tellurite resistance protein B-like protein